MGLGDTLPYRPCVGIMLIGRDKRIFTARRTETANAWQMPQGGIDPGEQPLAAAQRELAEETGVTSIDVWGETADWLTYDLPSPLQGKVWGGRYRGQTQKWFAFGFTGTDDEIDLEGHHGEFDAWRWATPEQVLADIVPFKRDVYRAVLDAFWPYLR